jgi:hypothetical protein
MQKNPEGPTIDRHVERERYAKEAYNNASESADFDLLFIAGLLNAANNVFRALIFLRQGATQQGTDSGMSEQVTTAKEVVALGGIAPSGTNILPQIKSCG